MGTDPHLISFPPCMAAVSVVIGLNLSLCLFWDASLEVIGRSLRLFSRASFFAVVTDQSQSHASSASFLPLMNTMNQGYYLKKALFLAKKNISKNNKHICNGVLELNTKDVS